MNHPSSTSSVPAPNSRDTREPRVIVGSGRSGTTWLLDAVAGANHLRTVFEPLNPRGVRAARELPLLDRTSGPPSAAVSALLTRAFDGRLRGVWTDWRILPRELIPLPPIKPVLWTYRRLALNARRYWRHRSEPVITKLIRANLMLEWILERFDARVLFLVRHPAAVVASRLRFTERPEWNFEKRLSTYLADPRLRSQVESRIEEGYGGERTPAGGHAALWCIENATVLRYAESRGIAAYFEPLVLRRPEAWESVRGILHVEHLPESAELGRPSERASADFRREIDSAGPVYRWTTSLSDSERAAIERMLKAFEVTRYSLGSPLPLSGDGERTS